MPETIHIGNEGVYHFEHFSVEMEKGVPNIWTDHPGFECCQHILEDIINPPLSFIAPLLVRAAKAIANYIQPKHNQIVLLGRDSWVLVPLLRQLQLAVPCNYFIFSRPQIGDIGTQIQWLKEVMPHALVVDTGYQGTIFDAIKEFDSTAEYILVHSTKDYPQIKGNNSLLVHKMEQLPKTIKRGILIDSQGVVLEENDYGAYDDKDTFCTTEETIQVNNKLCSLLHIESFWSTFTGLTPESRIESNLSEWYLKVYHARKVI